MNYFLLLIFFTVSIFGFSQNQNEDCSNYKIGDFITSIDIGNGQKVEVVYSRNEKTQTETLLTKDGELGKSLRFNIIWINDCKYILREILNESKSKKLLRKDILCKIIEIDNDFIVVKAKMKGKKWLKMKMYHYTPKPSE